LTKLSTKWLIYYDTSMQEHTVIEIYLNTESEKLQAKCPRLTNNVTTFITKCSLTYKLQVST